MAHGGLGLTHLHKRKNIFENLEPYPHPLRWKRFLDKSIYFIAVASPLMTLPQLIKIWIEQTATGVSAITWFAYLVSSMFWLTYGIAHKEKPIIITNILWIILDIAVIIGILIYG
jgi:uncharacterized protein with PQ loop repeat